MQGPQAEPAPAMGPHREQTPGSGATFAAVIVPIGCGLPGCDHKEPETGLALSCCTGTRAAYRASCASSSAISVQMMISRLLGS